MTQVNNAAIIQEKRAENESNVRYWQPPDNGSIPALYGMSITILSSGKYSETCL